MLDRLLFVLKANHVPSFLMQMLFKQIFAFINVQLFNQLLLRRECCSFSNGEYVKTGLAEVEHWIDSAGRKFVGDSWDELKFIRQVRNATPPLMYLHVYNGYLFSTFREYQVCCSLC